MAAAHEREGPPDAVEHPPITTATYQSLLHFWAAMHGFSCLEAFGHLDWLSGQARDELFASQVAVLLCVIGGQAG